MTLDPSTNGISRINFARSPESIVHKRILQTEARIQQNHRVLPNNLLQLQCPINSPSRNENEDPQHKAEPNELEVHSPQDHKKSPGHNDQSDNLHQSVPTRFSGVNGERDLQAEQTDGSQLELLKGKKLELTRPTDHGATNSKVCVSSDESSFSSSRDRLSHLGTLVTRARGNRQSAHTRISSLVGDESLVESKTTEKIQFLQESQDTDNKIGRNNGIDNKEYDDRFTALSRLKARLEMVRNEKATRALFSRGHSMNPNVTENWMVDSPPPSPPSSPAPKQARNSEHFLNRLVSKETHYIKAEYHESESKTDDLGIKVESRLCSHYMEIQQNEIGANEAVEEDPMIRLVYLAKELADQAGKMGFLQSSNDEHISRLTSLPGLPMSTVSHHSMIFHNQESFTSLDPSIDKLHSHPALTNQTSGSLPPFEYLLKKLQAAEEECMELTRSKDALAASLTVANNVRHDLEVSVQTLKEELEAAQATNRVLSEGLDSAKEEIATLTDRNEKLEGELARTQNRLGDKTVHVAELELVGASLHQMVEEKDKEMEENMVLFKDQHESVVSVLDDARVIRHLMADLQQKLQPKGEEDSEGDDDPERRARKLWDDWLKEALPRLDAMDMTLTTCKLELEVKVQCSDDDDHDKESSEAAKARWSLFRLRR